MNMNGPASHDIAAQHFATVTRRRFLRGLGACMALPALETLRPLILVAAQPGKTVAAATPRRMAFLYFPNGALQQNWWPKGEGKDFTFNRTMEPLESIRHKLQVIGGLDHRHATAGPDGAGDHARANGTFLTGVRVKKTAGGDIRAGVSIDQLVAQQVFPNRSKAIQAALQDKLTRMRHSRLARESAKLDPHTEQALAEEGMDQELATWPEY